MQLKPDEILKNIPGFTDYKVSNYGRVISYKGKKPLELKQHTNHGYKLVTLSQKGINKRGFKTLRVHRLVLRAFVGPPPKDKTQTRHLDGDKTNNHISNLKWGNAQENSDDKIRHGTIAQGETHSNTDLTETDVLEICRLLDTTDLSMAAINRRYNSTSIAYRINSGETWGHLTSNHYTLPIRDDKDVLKGYSSLTETQVLEIVRLIKETDTHLSEIDRQYGLSCAGDINTGKSYTHITSELVDSFPIRTDHKSAKGNASLTKEEVLAIEKALRTSKITKTSLGKKYGVSNVTIANIDKGFTWTDVTSGPYPMRKNLLPSQKTFKAISPDGQEFLSSNQTAFAKKHGLDNRNINAVLKGRCKTHKGWRFEYV